MLSVPVFASTVYPYWLLLNLAAATSLGAIQGLPSYRLFLCVYVLRAGWGAYN